MNTQRNILFITISAELGGAERSLIDLVKATQTQSPHKSIVLLPRKGPLVEQLKAANIETHILRLPRLLESVSRKNIFSFWIFFALGLPSTLIYYVKLSRLLHTFNPVAVHSTGIKNHIFCCALSIHTKWHYYIHLRDFIKSKILMRFLKLFSNKHNIHWMSASKAITQNLKWEIPIFYDGLNPKVFYKHRSLELKKSLGLHDTTILIGHAAALTPWKGQMLFIEAAAALLKTKPYLHFVIIGSTIYKTNQDQNYELSLKNKVVELKIEKHIHFVPFIKNSREIYDNIDIFVHCSLEPEPFGRVVVESLFCETPTVAAQAGGVVEILKLDTAKPLLHTPNDTPSLTSAIENALSFNPKHLEELSQNVRTHFPADLCYKRQVDYLSKAH